MRTRYRLTGLLGSAAAVVMLLAGTALAQSMRPGLNLMNDKPPPSKEEKEKQKEQSTMPTDRRLKNFPKRKNRLIHGKVSDQPHRGKVNNRRQQRCSDAPGSQHARVKAGTSAMRLALGY
jgi:hypothetical protein